MRAGFDEQLRAFRDRHVGPPIPGGDADLLGDLVEAEDGAALVGAGDDEGAVQPGEGVGDGGDDEGLPLAGDGGHVDFSLLDQSVDERAAAQGAGDDGGGAARPAGGDQPRLAAGDALDVGLEIGGGAEHAGVVGAIEVQRGRVCLAHQGKGAGGGLVENQPGFQAQADGLREGGRDEGERENRRAHETGKCIHNLRTGVGIRRRGRSVHDARRVRDRCGC